MLTYSSSAKRSGILSKAFSSNLIFLLPDKTSAATLSKNVSDLYSSSSLISKVVTLYMPYESLSSQLRLLPDFGLSCPFPTFTTSPCTINADPFPDAVLSCRQCSRLCKWRVELCRVTASRISPYMRGVRKMAFRILSCFKISLSLCKSCSMRASFTFNSSMKGLRTRASAVVIFSTASSNFELVSYSILFNSTLSPFNYSI